ncbi:hypothetical protein ACIQOU_04605 [Streptomyces sp. NPDC091279]|uniref:hypothetical protein n=1 Tax=Streptomyces sp. NPDC091279 TaxID=3365983 RepID=UPI0038105ED8
MSMTYPPPTSVFASVRQHFDNPRVKDAVTVTVTADTNGAAPVRLTAAEAHEALYGPDADPHFSAAVWTAVLSASLSPRASHGAEKLLVIWLALPRMAGTVHRICSRLRADRSDVEAEMALALLQELAAPGTASRLSITPLIKAARKRAWCFARARLREIPSTRVETITQDNAVNVTDETVDTSTRRQQGLDVQVDRPDGPDGLHAPLRFQVRPEHLRDEAFVGIDDEVGARKVGRSIRNHRIRRRVGTLPIRRAARRP